MELTPETMRDAILARFPDLAAAQFTFPRGGWDSLVADVDGSLIFKFPRHADGERRLKMEARLLPVIRPAVTMAVPDMTLYPGPPLFSRHAKLPGGHLFSEDYARLPEAARRQLAADMALFYAELHRLPAATLRAAGAMPIMEWWPPDEMLRRLRPILPAHLLAYAEASIAAWRALPPDPHGTTYGFFDGHGWNMAFDHAGGRLNGLYDFADSGFGALHQEFIYTSWTATDLTARIIDEYERLTGRALDRQRIDLLSGILRLSELAETADDDKRRPEVMAMLAAWVGR